MAVQGQAFPQLTADCWNWVKSSHKGRIEWPGEFASYRSCAHFLAVFNTGWDAVALDVTRPFTRTFTQKLFQELMPLFPDAYFHLGGDEVSLILDLAVLY